MRVLNTCEVEDPDAVSELGPELMGEGNGQRCLTDTCRPAKSDKPASEQVLGQREDVCAPPDYPGRPRGKVKIRSSIPRVHLLGRLPPVVDRSHKAVASSRNVRYVMLAILTVAQGTPQLSDVEAKATLVNG
jgi:hypothetical protein